MRLRISLLTSVLFIGIVAKSQQLTPEVQATIDACLALRAAVGAGSNVGLKQANKALKASDVKPFNKLRCREEQQPSLQGHFVFDQEFVDSLIQNRKERATSSSGKVFAKTCMVKGKKSITYTLVAKGTQYISVVTEPKGLVTLRIHDKTNDKWYNDTDDVNIGRPSRIQTLDLPKDKNCLLEIEIINTSKKDMSFVIIGN